MSATDRPTEWLRPAAEQAGLKHYLQTLRERIWLVVLAVVITTGVAVLYVLTTDKVYEASATILVSPVPAESETLGRLGLIRESNDPLRVIETAAELIENRGAGAIAIDRLEVDTVDEMLRSVRVEPIAESNLLTVIAEAPTPELAAKRANVFARSAIEHRTEVLHERIDEELPRLQSRLGQLEPGTERDILAAEIAELEATRAGSDPTLSVEERANPPNGPVSPRRMASVLAGIVAGLVLGIGGAFALQVLDPRLRREEQLRARFGLPILARIPKETGAGSAPLPWPSLSAGSVEAYRTLRSVLTRPTGPTGAGGTIMVTSSGPSEGKTTSAISLATSLALAGSRVILVEADLRRPTVGETLGITTDRGVVGVLLGEGTVRENLVSPPYFAENMRLLLAETAGAELGDLLTPAAGQRLLDEARTLADYVIVDSPPLATVVDALPLAGAVDHLLLVAMLGRTSLRRLEELAELLIDSGIRPVGFALSSTPRTGRGYYSDYGYRTRAMEEAGDAPAETSA